MAKKDAYGAAAAPEVAIAANAAVAAAPPPPACERKLLLMPPEHRCYTPCGAPRRNSERGAAEVDERVNGRGQRD
ncbi:hypothetical protein cyc_04737 [Cyclospora cayetanensis]|uniref:Uncharacterized protein n=1 Tax=Cyclospora cayetanensis TaxID=88456 RepID=A0A1D3D546_9EIME|nr:hypothetical protein cyc_04737 [Cyclospora cayetanensis]